MEQAPALPRAIHMADGEEEVEADEEGDEEREEKEEKEDSERKQKTTHRGSGKMTEYPQKITKSIRSQNVICCRDRCCRSRTQAFRQGELVPTLPQSVGSK